MKQRTIALAIMMFVLVFLMPAISQAVFYEWTWMSGSNTIDQAGVYGTKGTPDAANLPGARSHAISWADSSGNFWLFGGYDSITYVSLNDLWRYDPETNLWTWMSGSNTGGQSGVYGTKGIPDAANVPGHRYGSISWTDSSGNLWLFGGADSYSGGTWNDLWRYEPATNQWTWMSGADTINQTGTYGTKGTPDAANVPGARYNSSFAADSSGNLWLFGGTGCDSSGNCGSRLNDLWRYDPETNQWTWMSGLNTSSWLGVYGIKGTPDAANVPGARTISTAWIDSDDNFWLFGGDGYDSVSNGGELNDLWRYDPETNQWTWMSGADTINQAGTYGTQGTPDAANVPGARYGSISWTDSAGNLWVFGGWGFDSAANQGYLNGLWRYDPAADMWTWMSGSNTRNQLGIYGTKGTPDAANVPGARQYNTSWIDSAGSLWLFGGYGYSAASQGGLNDLWRYEVPVCVADSDCDDGEYCNGVETCDNNTCFASENPCDNSTQTCDEETESCVECLSDTDCGALNTCEDSLCVPFPTTSSVTTVTLKGPGVLDVVFALNEQDIARIELTGTTESSSLSISSVLKKTLVYLDELVIDGSLKDIKGKAVVLTGEMTATGGISKMQIDATEPKSSIEAAWIGKLSIAGDFEGDMELSGDGSPPKGFTLGKVSIKGVLSNSEWIVNGNVSSVKVGTWGAGSTLAVGVDPGSDGRFFTEDDEVSGGALGKVKYKYYDIDNGGEAFGIIADEFLKLKNLLPFQEGDFSIWEK